MDLVGHKKITQEATFFRSVPPNQLLVSVLFGICVNRDTCKSCFCSVLFVLVELHYVFVFLYRGVFFVNVQVRTPSEILLDFQVCPLVRRSI